MLDVYGLEEIKPEDAGLFLDLLMQAEELRETAKRIGLMLSLKTYPSGYCHVRVGGTVSGRDYVANSEPGGDRLCYLVQPDGRSKQVKFPDVNFEEVR